MKKNLILIAFLFFFLFLSACNDEQANQPENNTDTNTISQASQSKVSILNLSHFKVLSMTEGLFENAPALQVNLTLPIDENQNVSQLVEVTTNKQSVNGDWIYSDNRMVLYFPFIQSDTQYQIKIDANLMSVKGKKIDKNYSKIIKTKRKQKNVRFVSKGNTLLKDSNKLPIEAVNVSAVDLKFWRIKNNKYHEFLRQPNRRDTYYLRDMSNIADLVYTSQFALDMKDNKTEKHNLSIADIKPIQQAGIYFVTMIASDSYPYEVESSWFSVTDIGLHSRKFPHSMAVFAHKIPEATAYANVELSLLNVKGEVIENVKTDQTGFAELTSNDLNKANLIIATQGSNSNLIRINQPKMDLTEFSLSNRAYKTQELFLYAPRDLYRPGEAVNINALLRDADGQMVTATPVRVEIKRPDNRTFKTFNWQGDENSFYTTQFKIPSDAMTGEWIFTAKLANNDVFQYPFAVEDFMPERLKLDLAAGNDSLNISLSETPKIKVQSDYLYGAPAAKNRFDATVTVNAQNKLFEDYADYSFGSNNYKEYDLNFTTASQLLDEQGSGVLSIKPNWKSAKFPLRVKSFVNVYESGGRPISRKIIQTIWPYDVAIGVRSLWDGDYASPNSNSDIELLAINQQGQRIAINNAEVLLIRENSQRYWHWGDDGWSYNQSQHNIPVYSSIVNISDNTKTQLSLPLDYGNYRVEIRNQKQQLISSYQFFSGWRWYNQNSASGERPDQIKLQWQADSLTSGSEAELKVTAPYTGTALITVESDALLWKKTIQMNSAEQTIKIPIDANWKRHDIHATVMVIQKGEVKRKHLPTRAFGVIHLPINRDDRKLDIVIDAPEKILPDREVTIKVKAANLKNTQTFVTLGTVDTGVLNVSNFDTPKPHEWFFATRQYIAEIRDMYGSIIALVDGKNTNQKFGGDADLARGGDEPSSDVQIISMISDKVQFDADGVAEITVKMPYFNGEVRLMAMAFNDNQFAGADTRMKVAAPVVIETSLPRFIAKGDETFATIDVHNTENTSQSIDLKIIASDSLGGEIFEQKIELSANQKEIFKLPIKALLHSGTGQIDVVAHMKSNDAFSVNRQWTVGIRPAFPAIIKSSSDIIDAGNSFKITNKMFDNFDQANLKSVLKISNLPVLNADEQLQHLIQYPYGCLEQTTSRAWPLMLVEKSDLGLFETEQQEKIYSKRSELIDGAISRLLGMQRYDGSFGLWNSDSHEEYWLTVYVTEFMLKARGLGYNISKSALEKAIKRLQYYVKGRAYLNSDLKKYLSNVSYYKLSYRAYAAYVLAGIKQVNLQDIRKLFDNNADKSKSPLPLAYLALALEKMGDNRRAQQAWLKAVDFKWTQDRYRYYGDYGSKIRDLAQVVQLGLQSNLTHDLPKSTLQMLKPLQQELRTRRWLSTQERGAIFRVAKALKNSKSMNKKWRATLSISKNKESFEQAEDLIRVWYQKDASRPLTVNNSGDIPLYVDFKTQGYLKDAIPESNGINVERRFFNLQGEKLDISKLSTGDMVLVHIKINLEKKYSYLPDAMLIELLPAGLELENQNLEHSMKLGGIKIDGKKVTDMIHTRIKHSEYRDDRYIAALTLSGYSDNNLFYLARAVTPGTYTVPPSLVEDMYRPEIRAIGESVGKMVISE